MPAILAYREAELFANLVSILDLFPSSPGDGGGGIDSGYGDGDAEDGAEERVLEGILRSWVLPFSLLVVTWKGFSSCSMIDLN